MKYRKPLQTVVLAIALIAAADCARKKLGPASEKPASLVLATVGERAITEEDFKARLAAEPAFSIGRYASPERKKELLGKMVETELLLHEARRRGVDQDPEVRVAFDRLLTHRLIEIYAADRAKAAPTSDADLRRYYDQHVADFVTPTRVRVSHLFLAAPEKDPKRASFAAEAERLGHEARAKESGGHKQGFEQLASERSDDAPTKARGGDLDFRTREELAQLWGASFADAALAMKTIGQLGPVVATDKGFHLVKLLGRHEGYETSFESARGQIEQRLRSQARSDALASLVSELKQRTPPKVDEGALARLQTEPPPQPAVARGGTPR